MRHEDRPNILILMTDQQSHSLLSCAGTPWVSTPNLDRLAAGGVRFARSYCSDPVCVPSRFSLFTGRMPSAIGLRGNGGRDLHRFTPEQDRQGLGHLLRGAGYETWYGGKVHWPIGLDPERLGFGVYSDDEREGLAVAASRQVGELRGRRWALVASFVNPHDICYQAIRAFAAPGSGDHRLVERGAQEIAALDEALRPPPGIDRERFLRELLPPLPPNHQPQADEPGAIAELLARRPFRGAARAHWGAQDWRLHRWAYARLMERVDRQIGAVLDAVEASCQAERTLVIMTSDHGDHGGAHKLEHKTIFYEEAARVPWLMRLPGRIPAGAVVDDRLLAAGLDLLPTCCDYAGVPAPSHCLGISQRPVAEGRADAAGRDAAYGENEVSRMLVTRHWKLVRYRWGANGEQLYDLDRDPGETRDHGKEPANADALAELRRRLDREIAAHAALALGPMDEHGWVE
jgi:choline-sulfatase